MKGAQTPSRATPVGGVDLLARIAGGKLTEAWGSRPSSIIGRAVASLTKDGGFAATHFSHMAKLPALLAGIAEQW